MTNNDNQKDLRRGGFYFKDGVPYISVTRVLQIINKPQLLTWAARETYRAMLVDPGISEDQAVVAHLQSRDKAASRGATIHSLIEVWKQEDQLLETVPPEFRGYYQAFKNFVKDQKVEIVAREKTVFSDEHKLAGTLDMLIKKDDEFWIVDAKTNKDGVLYQEVELQLSAYKHMIETKPTRIFGLGLSEAGVYNLKEYTDQWPVFLHLLEAWKWQNRELIKKVSKNEKV